MSQDLEELYPCVGICTPDPDSGYCLGCGRPPLDWPEDVATTPAAADETDADAAA